VNPQTWNNRANLLYLELPAGVGYSQGPEDEPITDDIVIEDAMTSLRLFYARFPAYRKNDLFLAGHGYGGVFVTKLAQAIVE
jgi:carboxypeptidase C (cathepsin A)